MKEFPDCFELPNILHMSRGGQNNGNFISKHMTIVIHMVIACVFLVSS